MYDLILSKGRIATSSGVFEADLAISDGKIASIGKNIGSAIEVVDVSNLVIMPGVIDTQVHFREPGLESKEDLESGTRAALHGGITSVLEMPNTVPATVDSAALADKCQRATGRIWTNIGFFIGASSQNSGFLGELENLPGTPGVKIFMGSSTGSLLVSDDDDLRRVLFNCRKRCPIHAEDEPRNRARKSLLSEHPHASEHPFLRDSESARLATERILRLSDETKHPVHILHVSTIEEPRLIAQAKSSGLRTTAEVTPQHLFFSAPNCYERLGSLVQMNPPIRGEEHRAALWKALDEGVFDVFGSDHAPHTLAEKSLSYPQSPSGMPGAQTLLQVLLTFVSQGKIDLPKVVRMACEVPGELYHIKRKGKIMVGFDADLTLIDPSRTITFERSMVESKCGWSPYEGEKLTGTIEGVLLAGKWVLRNNQCMNEPAGRILEFEDGSQDSPQI